MGSPAARTICVGVDQAAAAFGVDPRTVRRWCEAGMPHGTKGRALQIELAPAIAWVRARDVEALEKRISDAAASLDLPEARARKARADADLTELQLAERRRDVIKRTDAESAWSHHVLQVRARLLALPSHARVQGVPEPACRIFDRLLRAALQTLANPGQPAEAEAS